MEQDRKEEPGIIARLGLNPKAVELARSRTPFSRRRSMFNRLPLDGISNRSILPQKSAPSASFVGSAESVDSVGDGAQFLTGDDALEQLKAPNGNSGRSDERDGPPKRMAPSAGLKRHFYIAKSVLPKSATPRKTLKNVVRVYGKQRPALTPTPAPRRRDIYEFEDSSSGPTTPVVKPISRTQVEVYSSSEEDEEASPDGVARQDISMQKISSLPVEDGYSSQESLNLVEQLVKQRKFHERTPELGQKGINQHIYTKELSSHRTSVHLLETTGKAPSPCGHEIADGQERRSFASTAQQEPLDDLDVEILQLLGAGGKAPRNSYQKNKRDRASLDPNDYQTQAVNFADDERDTVDENDPPTPKKRCLGYHENEIRKNNIVHGSNAHKGTCLPRPSLKDQTQVMVDFSNLSTTKKKKTKGREKRNTKTPRRLPVNELTMISKKMTASNLDEDPGQLSGDPISQNDDDDERPRKFLHVKLGYRSRNRLGRLEISQFRVPKFHNSCDVFNSSSYNDGFEGEEAKPSKRYMPIKKVSRRKEAVERLVIRMPKLTIVAEKPYSGDDEVINDQSRRHGKKKRGDWQEGQNQRTTMDPSHTLFQQENSMTMRPLRHIHVECVHKLSDSKQLPECASEEKNKTQNLARSEQRISTTGPSNIQSVQIQDKTSNAKIWAETPISKRHLLGQENDQNDYVVQFEDRKSDVSGHPDAILPSTSRISTKTTVQQQPGPQQSLAEKKTSKARRDSIRMLQELSLVSVKRKTQENGESEGSSESDSETSELSDRSSSEDEDEEPMDEDDEASEPEESSVKKLQVIEVIVYQHYRPHSPLVVCPTKVGTSVCNEVDGEERPQSVGIVQGDLKYFLGQEVQSTADDKQLLVVQGYLGGLEAEKHPRPAADQELSFAEDGTPHKSQRMQDGEIMETQLHYASHEIEEPNLTQENPTLPPQQLLAGRAVALAPSSPQPTPGQSCRLHSIALAASQSLFSPQTQALPHNKHVSFCGGIQQLSGSLPENQRHSQQSYVDPESAWRPHIPHVVDMSLDAGDDIVDTSSSPTPLSYQARVPNKHHKLARRGSLAPLQSLRVDSLKTHQPVTKVVKKVAASRGTLSDERHSQLDFVPSQPSFIAEDSQTLSLNGDLEIPETQNTVLPNSAYFIAAGQQLNRSSVPSLGKPRKFQCRMKSSPSKLHYPPSSQHSELPQTSQSELLNHTILSTPMKVPRQNQKLSDITRRASQNLGTRSGTPLSSAVRRRIPSLLQHKLK